VSLYLARSDSYVDIACPLGTFTISPVLRKLP
jgi:hypothetical protein